MAGTQFKTIVISDDCSYSVTAFLDTGLRQHDAVKEMQSFASMTATVVVDTLLAVVLA